MKMELELKDKDGIEEHKKRLNRTIKACEELQESIESDVVVRIKLTAKFENVDISLLNRKISQQFHQEK